MKRSLLILFVLAGLAPQAHANDGVRTRRFALIVGSNDGGAERVKLRYAGTDAKAVARVLRELGGVADTDVVLLEDPDLSKLEAGFDRMRTKIGDTAAGVRTELLVYYSGHSDESGLLLYGKRFGYPALRQRIREMPSDVNIAILDSCASGAFTRRKGGKRVAPFLVDESSNVRGYAFLTSSSADEAAQESDRIAASFFTHYLVSGLRGGADANRDGRVTLNEAYQFAFAETVTRTDKTQAGAQHPAYAIHLVGTGDVVMTDLRSTSAALVVAKDVDGRLFIKDADGRLVIELQKPAGRPVVLGLGPDRYELTLHKGNDFYRAAVQLERGKRTRVAIADFRGVDAEPTVARGGAPGDTGEPPLRRVPVSFQLIPSIAIGAGGDTAVVNNFSLNLLVGRSDHLEGVEIGGLVNVRDGNVRGAQLAGLANHTRGDFEGIQLAGITNGVIGDGKGAQLSGIANLTGRNFRGLQVAGIANAAGGNFEGLQVSGIANWGGHNVRGAQISLLNVGGSVNGAQIGLVNIARRSRGLQLGLVNVADESEGVPLGLVNIVRNGYRAVEMWSSDTAAFNAGVKLGGRRFYTILTAASDESRFMAGWGLGVHTPFDGYYIDVDLLGYSIVDHDFEETEDDLLTKLRVSAGYRVNQHISVFGGVSANGTFAFGDKDGEGVSKFDGKRIDTDDFVLRLTPGFFAGIQF